MNKKNLFKRKEFNSYILDKCIELLKSSDENKILEGIIFSSYLIEQTLKYKLKKINPLLYYDLKDIPDDSIINASLGKLSTDEILKLKTIKVKTCMSRIFFYNKILNKHKAKLEELFKFRNFLIHSIDDIPVNIEDAEVAVSSLKALRKYIASYLGISSKEFNPLTSKEFQKLEKKYYKKSTTNLKNKLKEYKSRINNLTEDEILNRIKNNLPKTDNYSWVDGRLEKCPACRQISLDMIGEVDFGWNRDGILTNADSYYKCRVCGIKLSEYEYELVLREGYDQIDF